MRKLALLFLLALLPIQAWALNTDQLLSTIAMPLAVAAVSNVSGVPASRLADVVVALNQANVPPTQFVEVIRFVPVALVVQNNQQPDFVQFVQTKVSRGVMGDALVNAIAEELRDNFKITPVLTLNGEPTTVVVQDDFVPPIVVSRVTTVAPATTIVTADPLAVIALPLAVAAVADIAGVPRNELANLVAALNNANVPPAQVVQVLRFAPVALIVDNGQPFVQFVQQQTAQGVTGPALVPIVVQRLRTFFPAQTQIVVTAPPPQGVVVERDFIPPVVISRVEEVRLHPHGGPPGQIKKELGLQTGAEVVHGEKEGRQFTPPTPAPVVLVPEQRGEKEKEHGRGQGKREEGRAPAPMMSSGPPAAPAPVPAVAPPPGKEKGREEGGPPKQQKPKGGKEHGKD